MFYLAGFLALLSAGRALAETPPARFHIAAPASSDRPAASPNRFLFDAKRSSTFLQELQSFLSLLPEPAGNNQTAGAYARFVETFADAASREGVASSSSGNLVGLAYDWTDRSEWKYFVRLEVGLDAFEALFENARQDPLYRDLVMASLIYGGQGILDFKRYVPDYIDHLHQQQEFEAAQFDPRNRKQARSVYRLAAQQVSLQLARYRTALAYLRDRRIDSGALQQRAETEPRPEIKSLLVHYAELLRCQTQRAGGGNDLSLRIAVLLSDVERESPGVVTAVLRIGEKNKQVVFDKEANAFEADPAAFRFLIEAGD